MKRDLLMGLFLGGCAWTDSRKREISLLWILLWAAAGSFYLFAGMWSVGVWSMEEGIKRLGGIFCGLFLLIASAISKGQVGIGDGLVFLVCGLFLDFWESSSLLLGGLFLLVVRCLFDIFFGKGIRKKELPLMPYIFAAYAGGLLWRL